MGNILTKCCSDDRDVSQEHINDTRITDTRITDKKTATTADHNNNSNPYPPVEQPKHDILKHSAASEGTDIPLTDQTLNSALSSSRPSSSNVSLYSASVAAQQQTPQSSQATPVTPSPVPPSDIRTSTGSVSKDKVLAARSGKEIENAVEHTATSPGANPSTSRSFFKRLSSFVPLTNSKKSNIKGANRQKLESITLAQGLELTGITLSEEERKVLLSNEIPASEIENLSIGVDAGGMGIIHVAEWKGVKVAIKEASPHVISKEVEIYSRMKDCEGVVLFYGVTYPPGLDKMCIVTKYAENGSLSWYLKIAFHKLTWANKLTLATQITKAIARLHQEGIYHRDLHGGNILIDAQGNAMLTDFGASTVMEERVVRSIDEYAITTLTTPQGGSRFYSQRFPDIPGSSSPQMSPSNSLVVSGKTSSGNNKSSNDPLIGVMAYIAPERFKKPSFFDARCDVYSLGVLLWELTSGHSAFAKSPQDIQLAVSILNGKREDPVEGTPASYQALYEQCWDPSPDARPTLDKILATLEQVKDSMSNEQLAITRERNSSSNEPDFEASLSVPRPTSDYQKYFHSTSSAEEL
ncbi:hypothetical protein BG004_006851 [Podila humilis]|nr:hypothetical protein BG004_006851 [Podila humilis]